jgi:hypothetical protein
LIIADRLSGTRWACLSYGEGMVAVCGIPQLQAIVQGGGECAVALVLLQVEASFLYAFRGRGAASREFSPLRKSPTEE